MALCENCYFYDKKENICINENARFNLDDECFFRIDVEDYAKIHNKAIDECIRIIEETVWKDADMLVEMIKELKEGE